MVETHEVVVIGGGAIGASAARVLAQRGVDVALLERNSIGNASTARAAGIFRRAFTSEATARLAARSVSVFEALEGETGIGLHQPGYLILANESSLTDTERAGDMAESLGAEVKRIPRADVTKYGPSIGDSTVAGGILLPGDGYADPYLFATAQARLAVDDGATLKTDCRVTDIDVVDGHIESIVADGRSIRGDTYINATGAWAGQLAGLVGIDLPVDPVRTFALTTPVGLPDNHPMVLMLDRSVYYREEPGGGTLIGGAVTTEPTDPDDFSVKPETDVLLTLGERAATVDSRFENLEIESSWAGLKSVTPDKLPIVGAHPDVQNLYHATGFNGHGFMLSPGVGTLLADLVTDEAVGVFETLSPSRFASGDDENESVSVSGDPEDIDIDLQ